MQKFFTVPICKPSSWDPPYVEEKLEESENPLVFGLFQDESNEGRYQYFCRGCLSAGGEIDDIFRTSSLSENHWPFGEGVPKELARQMYDHARQHEIMWRWSVLRIPPPAYDN